MLRITIFFLMSVVTLSAYGEELFSVDAARIKQVAIDAALLDHPELLPADLAGKNEGMIHIVCLNKDLSYKCKAFISFDILSTTQEVIRREGDRCFQSTTTESVQVTVLSDGSVSEINNSGRGTSSRSIDYPADIDDKELTSPG